MSQSASLRPRLKKLPAREKLNRRNFHGVVHDNGKRKWDNSERGCAMTSYPITRDMRTAINEFVGTELVLESDIGKEISSGVDGDQEITIARTTSSENTVTVYIDGDGQIDIRSVTPSQFNAAGSVTSYGCDNRLTLTIIDPQDSQILMGALFGFAAEGIYSPTQDEINAAEQLKSAMHLSEATPGGLTLRPSSGEHIFTFDAPPPDAKLQFTSFGLGNHEFDFGSAGVNPYDGNTSLFGATDSASSYAQELAAGELLQFGNYTDDRANGVDVYIVDIRPEWGSRISYYQYTSPAAPTVGDWVYAISALVAYARSRESEGEVQIPNRRPSPLDNLTVETYYEPGTLQPDGEGGYRSEGETFGFQLNFKSGNMIETRGTASTAPASETPTPPGTTPIPIEESNDRQEQAP